MNKRIDERDGLKIINLLAIIIIMYNDTAKPR